jgi:hypothetical protein
MSAVGELAVSSTATTAHVMSPDTVAEAPGRATFCVTVMLAVDVQLLAGFVALTVYTPGFDTSGCSPDDEKLPGPVQAYVTPVVGEVA